MKLWRHPVIKWVGLAVGCLVVGQPLPAPAQGAAPARAKPALYEFGAGYCVSCKAMARVMAELTPIYGDQVDIRLVYADKDKDLFQKYKIMLIPTQVFLDASGQEAERHVGSLSKAEVINRLKNLNFISK